MNGGNVLMMSSMVNVEDHIVAVREAYLCPVVRP